MKYIFLVEDNNDIYGNNRKIKVEFEADNISTLLNEFEYFLRGVGFHFNGGLEIVDSVSDKPENELKE